jgi:hypothetical protein
MCQRKLVRDHKNITEDLLKGVVTMKKIAAYTLLLIMIMSLCACQGSLEKKSASLDSSFNSEFQKVDPARLKSASKLAIAAFELAKLGSLGSLATVKMNPLNTELENKTKYNEFKPENIIILDYSERQDGTYSQSMLAESSDQLGRVDLSINRIAFKIRYPDEKEAAGCQRMALNSYKNIKGLDQELQNEIKRAIVGYQQATGLTSDGIMGEHTAANLSHKMPIMDIKELSSQLVYPQEPRHRFYILPFEPVAKDPHSFNKGFGSMAAVEKHSIPLDQFEEVAKPQKKFFLFVFFIDRVDPTSSIQVGFSDTAKRRSDPLGRKRYTIPGEWPVLIEPFSIDNELPSGSALYVNLFKTDESKSSFFTKTHCIGYCRLK